VLSPGPGNGDGDPYPLTELSTDYALDYPLLTLEGYFVKGGFLVFMIFGVILMPPSGGYSSLCIVSSTSSC
jgi:hypothetical protein